MNWRDLVPAEHVARHEWMVEILAQSIAGQIRALRLSRNLTQEKFGALCGMTGSTVSRLETPAGAIRASVDTLLRIAKAFDVALIIQFAGWPEFVALMFTPDGVLAPSAPAGFSPEMFASSHPPSHPGSE